MKTKILLLMAFCLLATSAIFAQKSYTISAGLTASKLGQGATKEIISRYNETRSWLDNKMGGTNPFTGYVFSAGVDKGNYTFLISANLQRATVKAGGTPPGGTFGERELRVKSSFWSANGLWDFGSMWDKDYGLGINLGIAIGGGDYSTRTTGESEFKKINMTGYDGSGIFLGLFYEHYLIGDAEQGIGLRITPYYRGSFGLISHDMTPLLQELDPVNANVPLDKSINGHGALGVMAEVVFRIER